MSGEDAVSKRKSSAAVYGTLSGAGAAAADKKRDRPKRAESVALDSGRKKIGSASLRQGALDGNDSSEEQQFSQRSARSSRRSLRPSASGDALDAMSGQEGTKRVVALEVQVDSLSSHTAEPPHLPIQQFIAPSHISQRYRDFLTWARKLNHSYNTLEVILLGAHGAGKSALIDALTGFPVSPIGVTTKRPIHFHLLDEPAAQSAKFTVRDSSGDFSCLLPEQAATEIRKRNKRSLEPIFVQIEFAWGFELTLIDTPAARTPEDISLWTSAPSLAQRIFLCVECCPNEKQHKPNTRVTDTLSLLPILRRVDPAMSNTFCILTRFDDFLDSFCGEPGVVEAAINAVSEEQHIVFATLPSDEIRTAAYAHKDSDTFFKTKIWQYDARDAHSLSRWFDLAATQAFLANHQGVACLRSCIFGAFERHLNALVPELSQAFADHDTALKSQLSALKRIRSRWNVENIRSSACEYATLYLRLLDDLIAGSSIGQPHSRGQTLKEEEAETGLSWAAAVSGLDSPIGPPQTSRSSGAQASLRLYGAPQLFRLLDDFRAFALKLEMPAVADSELSITSVDPAWTASEIARSKVEQQFVPLMHQLLDRSFQVLKRTATVADAVADEVVLTGAVKAQASSAPNVSSRRIGRSLSRIPSTLSSSVLSAELETSVKTASSVVTHLKAQPRRDSRLEPLSPSNAPQQEPTAQELDLLQEHTTASQVAVLTSKVTQREFPEFASFLKQSFLFGLSTLQRKCMQRCEDEFYGAHTLYWELTGGVDPLALAGMAISERQSSVKKLVLKLYAEIKSRLIDGFVRNVQTYFLNQSSYLDLMKSVLSEVSTLPHATIMDMFKLNAITGALDRRIVSLERKCSSLAAAQSKFSYLIK
eukprot:TRINITY_DN4055_c0_g3_i1.p1 TRINITY_DN4055_c0_g3~~TRINITY_DN4055_c0_g3_i1.p1  ORF type:complete len:886 (-),score=156.65 TRINITY_DN4055_c0_g3_i1:1699-4323(-)